MKSVRNLCAVVVGCFGCLATGWAVEAAVGLQVEAGSTSLIGASVSTGGSDSVSLTYTGTLEGVATFDDRTLALVGFRFTGGRIYMSDTSLQLTSDIPFTDLGTFRTTIRLSTRSVSFVPHTIFGEGAVGSDGRLETWQHDQFYDRGTVTIAATVAGVTQSETMDNAEFPNYGMWEGELWLESEVLEESVFERRVRLRFRHVVDMITSEEFEGTSARLEGSEKGTLTAVGEVVARTPFGQWVAERGLDLDTGEELNESGIPYRLLYALREDPWAKSQPFSMERRAGGDVYGLVKLPWQGLREGIAVEFCRDLDAGDWERLPGRFLRGGAGALDRDGWGWQEVDLPEGDAVFLRLVAGSGD